MKTRQAGEQTPSRGFSRFLHHDSAYEAVAALSRWFFGTPYVMAVAVALVFMVVSFVVNDMSRPLEWDEAVYLSEAVPSIPDVGFSVHRSRGIVLVAYPYSLLGTTSIAPLRIWLVIVHSLGLGVVVEIWRRLVGPPVLGSALIFGSSWLTLFYSAELSPNLLTGLLLASALGLIILFVRNPGRRLWAGLAVVLLAAGALVRPSDSVWYTFGAIAATTLTAIPLLPVLFIGLAGVGLGWVPWVIEAEMRFGGVLARFRAASEIVGTGAKASIRSHLELLDGPLVGPDPSGAIPWMGVAWLAGLLALSIIVLIRSWGGSSRNESVLPAGAAIGSAFPYVFLTGALAPRFLLPAYLALALVSGQALRVRDLRGVMKLLVWGAAAVVVVASFWQVGVAFDISSEQSGQRQVAQALGLAIGESSQGAACVVASQYGYPQIQVYSGCSGSRMTPDSSNLPYEMKVGITQGMSAFVVFWSEAPGTSPVATWSRTIVDTSSGEVYLYKLGASG